MIWSIPIVALASTLAGAVLVSRLGGRAPTPVGAAAAADAEIGDPSLRAMIGRFAQSARAQRAQAIDPEQTR
jgi:hypothetical protein